MDDSGIFFIFCENGRFKGMWWNRIEGSDQITLNVYNALIECLFTLLTKKGACESTMFCGCLTDKKKNQLSANDIYLVLLRMLVKWSHTVWNLAVAKNSIRFIIIKTLVNSI